MLSLEIGIRMLKWFKISNILRITKNSITPNMKTTSWTIQFNFDFSEPWEDTRFVDIASNYSKIYALVLHTFDLSLST